MSFMEDQAQEALDEAGYDGWEIESDVAITCPNGHAIEWDGDCPPGEEGCGPSPLKVLGLI